MLHISLQQRLSKGASLPKMQVIQVYKFEDDTKSLRSFKFEEFEAKRSYHPCSQEIHPILCTAYTYSAFSLQWTARERSGNKEKFLNSLTPSLIKGIMIHSSHRLA